MPYWTDDELDGIYDALLWDDAPLVDLDLVPAEEKPTRVKLDFWLVVGGGEP